MNETRIIGKDMNAVKLVYIIEKTKMTTECEGRIIERKYTYDKIKAESLINEWEKEDKVEVDCTTLTERLFKLWISSRHADEV